MKIEVQLDQLKNDKSIVAIFINGRPIHWVAYSEETPATDGKYWRNIIYQSFLTQAICKFTSMKEVSDKNLEVGITLLRKTLDKESVDKIVQVDRLLESIAANMGNQDYLS